MKDIYEVLTERIDKIYNETMMTSPINSTDYVNRVCDTLDVYWAMVQNDIVEFDNHKIDILFTHKNKLYEEVLSAEREEHKW